MAEHRYGYISPPPHAQAYDADAATRLRNMDTALRADIYLKARRQYETATRELRTQARAQAQAKAQSQAQAQAHAHAQAKAQAQAQAQAQARARARAQAHTPRYTWVNNSLVRPVPSSSSNISRHAPSAPSTSYQQLRLAPKPASTSISHPVDGDPVGLDELTRRYYAQLSAMRTSGYSRDFYQASLPFSNIYSQYSGTSARGQVRTMADDYLDFYMPARRGPQSPQSYQIHPETYAWRGQDIEYRSQQAPYHSDDKRGRFRTYLPEADRRNVMSETLVRRAGPEQPLRPLAGKTEEPSVRPRSSKGKLAFVLNPTASSSPKTSPRPEEQRNTSTSHSPLLSKRGVDEGPLKYSPNSGNRRSDPKEPTSSRSPPLQEMRSTSRAAGRSSENDDKDRPTDRGMSSSPPHPKDVRRLDTQGRAQANGIPQESLGATYNRPIKRKASPPPQSSVRSEASTEYQDADGAPRAKRRAFGRLPVEYDSHSELGPEEEEYADGRATQMTEASKADATPGGKYTIELE